MFYSILKNQDEQRGGQLSNQKLIGRNSKSRSCNHGSVEEYINARVVSINNKSMGLLGKFGEKLRSNRKRRMLEYCFTNNLLIVNTFFEHKEIHEFTRVEVRK